MTCPVRSKPARIAHCERVPSRQPEALSMCSRRRTHRASLNRPSVQPWQDLPRRDGRADEGGSLENCWAPFGVPWVRIPLPPPAKSSARKSPVIRTSVVDLLESQDALRIAHRVLRIANCELRIANCERVVRQETSRRLAKGYWLMANG